MSSESLSRLDSLWGEDPAEIYVNLCALLLEGCQRRHSPLHTLSLATLGMDRGPDVRTIVFRGFEEAKRQCRMHTDVRSPKVDALRRDPRAVLLWYAPEWKLQLRALAKVVVHHADAVSARCWEDTPVRSRRAYNAPLAPGSLSAEPVSDLAPHLVNDAATESNTAAGYPQFAVLLAVIHELEWLLLSANGNRRGRFLLDAEGWRHQWRAP